MKLRLLLLFAFALALGIRLYDLTDPPFDFHATRQFRSAVIARGMYFARLESVPEERREIAIQQWRDEQQLEPPLLEWLVSLTYALPSGEALWKARLLSLCFWVLGGGALYALIKELASPASALIGVLAYLFLPYGIIASRSFQPDPMMVAMTLVSIWRMYRWHQDRSWRNALFAGALAGIAILIKAVAFFPLGGVAVSLLFFDRNWKNSLRDGQTWILGLLALGPGAAYYVYGLFIAGFLRGQAAQSFLPNLWFTSNYYLRWAGLGVSTVGLFMLVVALAGVFLWQSKTARALCLGWWAGYAVYGLAFPYHIMTHDYYQLPLIPLVSFSLASVVHLAERRLAPYPILKVIIGLVIGGAVAVQVWNVRAELARKSYQSDAEEWGRYQTIIPPDQHVLALVQAYGYPLKYYGWTTATLWANTGDLALRELAGQSAEQLEQKRWAQLEGMDLFLVTNFNEFNRQPDLQEHLARYGIFAEGEGFILYDLRNLRGPFP